MNSGSTQDAFSEGAKEHVSGNAEGAIQSDRRVLAGAAVSGEPVVDKAATTVVASSHPVADPARSEPPINSATRKPVKTGAAASTSQDSFSVSATDWEKSI